MEDFPQGFDTMLGERGVTLTASGWSAFAAVSADGTVGEPRPLG